MTRPENLIYETGIKIEMVSDLIGADCMAITKENLSLIVSKISRAEFNRGYAAAICHTCKKWENSTEIGQPGKFSFCRNCRKQRRSGNGI